MIRSERATFVIRVAFSAAAAILILAGASLNAAGRSGGEVVVAGIAGFMAVVAGAAYSEWTIGAPMAVGSLLVVLLSVRFNMRAPALPMELAGVVVLALGGCVGVIAYRSFTEALTRRMHELEDLNSQLEDKQRAFLAATQDAEGSSTPADAAALTAILAHHTGAEFACCYLVSPDGTRFMPQAPGIGLGRLHPQPVARSRDGSGPLISSVDAGRDFVGTGKDGLLELVNYVPDQMEIDAILAVPLPVGDRVSGFVLLGNKPGGFTKDDRRLAMTLARRAGTQLVTAHAVAMSQEQTARHSVISELVKEAAGKSTDDVVNLVLNRAKQVIRYDAGRIVLFQRDGTYVAVGTASAAAPIAKSLAQVRAGETVLRNRVPADDGTFSGVKPAGAAMVVHEALVPIRSATGVIGSLCLGRAGSTPFTQRDAEALAELGAMAGVAVENSRMLQAMTGQATKLDTALDALAEMAQALTSITEGAEVNERKMLEAAARITGASAGLLTRSTDSGTQRVIMSVGFPDSVNAMEFANGQGIVGAVALSRSVIALDDAAESFDLSSPPDLLALGLRSALCSPMIENGRLWGTLAVFDAKKREWTEDDKRLLATLGSEGVVSVSNAELYDDNQRSIWKLTNLQDALQAATSTLDLGQTMQRVLEGAVKASSAQVACLALNDSGQLILKSHLGTDATAAEQLALKIGGKISRSVMASGEPVVETMERKPGAIGPLNPEAVLCVPLTKGDKPFGIVFLANHRGGGSFTDDERNLAADLAAEGAVAIDRALLFKEVNDRGMQAIEAVAKSSDRRDIYTAGHSERVAQYALGIARQMNYAPRNTEAWDHLEYGARIHDIGKIGVPDAVLQKPGKLTDEEFEQMKAHTTIGYDILSGLKNLTDELVIVRSHHERFDGKGYPDHKKGDELPMCAWIVSAADAIDAMTSDRPYRRGMTLEVAMDQVRLGAGTHFHPDVAEAVLDAVANGKLKLIPPEVPLYADAPAIGAFENPVP